MKKKTLLVIFNYEVRLLNFDDTVIEGEKPCLSVLYGIVKWVIAVSSKIAVNNPKYFCIRFRGQQTI